MIYLVALAVVLAIIALSLVAIVCIVGFDEPISRTIAEAVGIATGWSLVLEAAYAFGIARRPVVRSVNRNAYRAHRRALARRLGN